jgi:hypothetical protein
MARDGVAEHEAREKARAEERASRSDRLKHEIDTPKGKTKAKDKPEEPATPSE